VEGLAELAFRRHHAQIHRYLTGKTGDPDRAEDLAQEVFLDATVALSAADFIPVSLPALLHTIAKRRFVDDTRRRRLSVDGSLGDGSLDELPALECDRDDRWAIADAIALLEPAERRIVAMRLLQGCPFREIARTLEVSEAAAKMRFQRALVALRRNLERQGIAP
jgi:RNA polymerase sigma-70 factor (ECF subfamily)